jgi:hypothetical protein
VTAQEQPAGICFLPGAVEIDAAILAEGLGLVASLVPVLIRNGEITSLCERGVGEDEGRHRLTFFYQGKRCRVIVDNEGRLLQRSTIDFGDRALPARLRRSEC